ncbi:MAG: DUF393 domain-containing protein [Candidatus Melainabacteria bacterium]|nr:DUF393 domain-containing protein [Candidatus Melainabacteria bacterium]
MRENRQTYPVIYDGDCGFCQTTVDLIKKLDWLNRFEFISFRDEQVLRKYIYLTKEKCEKEIFLINGDIEKEKYYHGGYDAFKWMTLFLPLTFLVSWIFFLPGVVQAGRIVYKIVAENRHNIRLGDRVCKVDKQSNK